MVVALRFSDTASQGTRRRCFLVLIVGAPGFFGSTSQGVRCRCFLALMVGALGFFDSTSQGPAIDVFSIDGGRSSIL
jgi:hypothetical protein